MTQPQIQRASKANNVHALPPPAAKKEIEQALPADKRDDFKDLMKAEKSASFHKGLLYASIPALALGAALALLVTTTMFDPIRRNTEQSVATGAAIAIQGER